MLTIILQNNKNYKNILDKVYMIKNNNHKFQINLMNIKIRNSMYQNKMN